MDRIKIYTTNDAELIEVIIDEGSYRRRQVMGENSLYLSFSLTEFIEIPIGSYVIYQEEKYTLFRPENLKKEGTRNFQYSVIFEGEQAQLQKYMFKLPSDGRVKFSLTFRPWQFLDLIVQNLNERDSGWQMGAYIDQPEKTIQFNGNLCSEALRMIAEAFETEWEVIGKTVSLKKVEYNKNNPLALSYGRGNGFKTGVGRNNVDQNLPIERLYVEGGTRNIDFSTYNSTTLLLPKSKEIRYDGEFFENETGFNLESSRLYQTDEKGFSLIRADVPLMTNAENNISLTDIYPMRVGEVTGVEVVDEEKHFYDFFDNTIPENLDYSRYRINGERMTVVFQSGMLSGRTFDIEQTDETVTGYIHVDPNNPALNRRFKLVPIEVDGVIMPGPTFKPNIGDSYAVFGMNMPQEYIEDDVTKTGASWDMFKTAVKYKFDNEEPRFSFTGTLDGIWSRSDWVNISGRLVMGGYINFSDNQFHPEGSLIRITAVKDFLTNPYYPQIELSNVTSSGTVRSKIDKIDQNEVVIDDRFNEVYEYSKRRFRDTQETMSMLENAQLHFSQSINPITVQTMQLLVGDEKLQFRFVQSRDNPVQVPHREFYGPGPDGVRRMYIDAGIIQHMTYGIEDISSSHNKNEYLFWDMPEYQSGVLDPDESYYVYARVDSSGGSGYFELTTESLGGQFDLLVGLLGSEYEGERSYVRMYGFTEILPGQITTSRIQSPDGYNYFNLVTGGFRSGRFDSNGNMISGIDIDPSRQDTVRVKGVLVQSPSGDENYIGVFRGEYNYAIVFYNGDEVTWEGSTYRYINDTPTYGIYPTNTNYWKVIAARGDEGEAGEPGEPGAVGPMPRVSEWNDTTQYESTDTIQDVVYVGSYPNWMYYTAIKGVGLIPVGTSPNNPAYWQRMNWFENVATNLLIANMAVIAGFRFYNNRIESMNETNGVPNLRLFGADGSGHFASRNFQWDAAGNVQVTGKIQSSDSGQRFVLDPNIAKWTFFNNEGTAISSWQYASESSYIGPQIVVGEYPQGGYTPDSTTIREGIIRLWNQVNQSAASTYTLLGGGTLYTGGRRGTFSAEVENTENLFMAVRMSNLPTSRTGLTSGYLWRDGENLKIVP